MHSLILSIHYTISSDHVMTSTSLYNILQFAWKNIVVIFWIEHDQWSSQNHDILCWWMSHITDVLQLESNDMLNLSVIIDE
jgi:hypothetical protein